MLAALYYRSIRSRVLSRDVVSVCPVCRLSSRFRKHSRDDRALPLALSFPHLHTVALSRARGARPMRKPTDPHLSPSSLFRRLEPATSERACRSRRCLFSYYTNGWDWKELPSYLLATIVPHALTAQPTRFTEVGARCARRRERAKDHAPGMAPGQHHGPRLKFTRQSLWRFAYGEVRWRKGTPLGALRHRCRTARADRPDSLRRRRRFVLRTPLLDLLTAFTEQVS